MEVAYDIKNNLQSIKGLLQGPAEKLETEVR